MHAASTAYSISAPVLSCCSRVIAGRSSSLPLGDQVHHLPAGHAGRPGGARQLEHEVGADPRILVGRRIGEDFERQRMEAVAGKHRLGLAERLVDGRLAAPEVGIVHARQIVMDQRIDVDRLDRAADAQRALPVDREQARRGDGEQRPEPLAAADRRMAHRFIEPLAAVARAASASARRSRRPRRGRAPLPRRAPVPAGRWSQPASKGFSPAGLPSLPKAICSIRACASLSRASQCRFSRSPS